MAFFKTPEGHLNAIKENRNTSNDCFKSQIWIVTFESEKSSQPKQ